MLVQIQQIDYKLQALKVAKWKHKEELESLLKDGKKNEEKIDQLNILLENLEKEIDELEDRREELFTQWRRVAYDVRPLEEHTYFLERNYHLSPWDLKYYHGCFHYPLERDHCDLPYYGFPYEGFARPADDSQRKRRSAERKREHMKRYEDRKKIEERPHAPEPSPPGDAVAEDRPKKERRQREPSPQNERRESETRQAHINHYKDRQKCEGDGCNPIEDDESATIEKGKNRYKR